MTEAMGEPQASTFLDSLGARGRRRAEPRASIAVAGAGCALAVLGVLIVSGDTGASDGDFNKVPGIILSALVVAAGLYTLHSVRQGAMATAGTVATALGVPPLMFFLTFDQGGFPPYSTEGILVVSPVAWLVAYAVGPGRGRPFFLGAGLIGLWFTILQLTENLFEAPFGFLGGGWTGVSSSIEGDLDGGSLGSIGPSFDAPDPTTLGLISLALGIGYLLVGRWLDHRGHHGAATPFAFAALPTLAAGLLFLAGDLEQAGTGLLTLVVGAGLAHHGGAAGRRVTAWVGGAATALGAAVFLADMTDDATIGGMLFLAAGIALVAAGHAVANALREPDEMTITHVGGPQALEPALAAPPPPPADPAPDDHGAGMPPPEDPGAPPH
jgi:hypothetical protein